MEGELQDGDLINRRDINAYEVKCGASVRLIREDEDDLAVRQCEQASADEEIQYVGSFWLRMASLDGGDDPVDAGFEQRVRVERKSHQYDCESGCRYERFYNNSIDHNFLK